LYTVFKVNNLQTIDFAIQFNTGIWPDINCII
jgi:hypothetical protein